MTLKLPRLIGHRGAASYAPENTIESIHTAADMGLEWVELDVKLTKDGIPILFHDDNLDRTTNGSGAVAEAELERIIELEAGSWYSEGFAGAKIPTLEEAIETLVNRNLGLNLEIKPCPGREIETAEIALDILSHYWDDHDKLLISSFQNVSLETARDMAGDWNRALLVEELTENWQEVAKYLEVSSINFDGNKDITREEIKGIIEAGYSCCAYTINTPEKARMLSMWEVNSLITDAPDVIEDSFFTVH